MNYEGYLVRGNVCADEHYFITTSRSVSRVLKDYGNGRILVEVIVPKENAGETYDVMKTFFDLCSATVG